MELQMVRIGCFHWFGFESEFEEWVSFVVMGGGMQECGVCGWNKVLWGRLGVGVLLMTEAGGMYGLCFLGARGL